ncbi:hypothetical protein FWH09_02865 [Candidatus Saccharibacteria bacterium]|nr:hypothetical protein [Candidatus Saccharibacteria bacterium]
MKKDSKESKRKIIDIEAEKAILRRLRGLLPTIGGILLLALSFFITWRYASLILESGGWWRPWTYLMPLLFAVVLGLPVGVFLVIKKKLPRAPICLKYSLIALVVICAILWGISNVSSFLDILNRCESAPTPRLSCSEIRLEIALTIALTSAVFAIGAGAAFFIHRKHKQKNLK